MHILEAIIFGPPPLWCRRCGEFRPMEMFTGGKRGEYECVECRKEMKREQQRVAEESGERIA